MITGGARGIGLALGKACAADGMAVVLSDLAEDELAVAVGQLGDAGADVLGVAADVRDVSAMVGLRDATLARFGRADLVSLNAGVAIRRDIADMTESDWDWILGINLRGVIRGVTAFLPALEEQGAGHIQATASFHGHVGDPEFAGYCVTKWGVVALMETLHRELRLKGSPVSASVLCPGSTVTDLMVNALDRYGDDGGEADGADLDRSQRVHDDLQRGRSPDEVAAIALAGIRDGRFCIFTHPEQVAGPLRQRFEALARDGSLPPLPWSA